MKTKSFLLFYFLLNMITVLGQDRAFNLNIGYHYHGDDFYFSEAELDSSFSPERKTQLSLSLEYMRFYGENKQWFILFRGGYVSRGISYRFSTAFENGREFIGDLSASYLDLAVGGGYLLPIKTDLNTGIRLSVGYGTPLQNDTITSELPPYPIRIASNTLTYLELGIPIEQVFGKTNSGFWKIGLDGIVRAYRKPLHNFEAKSVLLSYGFTIRLGYYF
jgi:hypothetical protein